MRGCERKQECRGVRTGENASLFFFQIYHKNSPEQRRGKETSVLDFFLLRRHSVWADRWKNKTRTEDIRLEQVTVQLRRIHLVNKLSVSLLHLLMHTWMSFCLFFMNRLICFNQFHTKQSKGHVSLMSFFMFFFCNVLDTELCKNINFANNFFFIFIFIFFIFVCNINHQKQRSQFTAQGKTGKTLW